MIYLSIFLSSQSLTLYLENPIFQRSPSSKYIIILFLLLQAVTQQITYANAHNIRTNEKLPLLTPSELSNNFAGSDSGAEEDYFSDHESTPIGGGNSDIIATPNNNNNNNNTANHNNNNYYLDSSATNTPNIINNSISTNNPNSIDDDDEFQKNLIIGLSSMQKTTAKVLQKQTAKSMEEWKASLNERIILGEKRLLSQIEASSTDKITAKKKEKGGIVIVSYLQLCLLILVMFAVCKGWWWIVGI